jgi:hypothetical protein
MLTLSEMAENGAIQILERTLAILQQRGWTPGVHRNMVTGEVDIIGAMGIASGVMISQIDDSFGIPSDLIPQAKRPAVFVALEASEWAVDCDLTAWQDQMGRSFDDVKKALQRAIDHLGIVASS